jgi:hypothetical protein
LGVAARVLVVAALAGAGFALGAALAPDHGRRAATTGGAAAIAPATNALVSVHAPDPIGAVPALVRLAHARAVKPIPNAPRTGTTPTRVDQTPTPAAHPSTTPREAAHPQPKQPTTQTNTQPRTGTGTTTFNDPFQPPRLTPGGSSTDGSGSG